MSASLKVSETEVTYNRVPVDELRVPLCEWLERHGIDPDEVSVPGWIVRDLVNRRVEYIGFHLDGCQGPGEEPIGAGVRHLTPDGHEVCCEVRRVQLEAPPLPWPRSLWLHIPPEGA